MWGVAIVQAVVWLIVYILGHEYCESMIRNSIDMLCKWQIIIKDDTKIASRINRWEYDIVR